eukprot:1157780-Pelagomonas_calceolata.AAC.7
MAQSHNAMPSNNSKRERENKPRPIKSNHTYLGLQQEHRDIIHASSQHALLLQKLQACASGDRPEPETLSTVGVFVSMHLTSSLQQEQAWMRKLLESGRRCRCDTM